MCFGSQRRTLSKCPDYVEARGRATSGGSSRWRAPCLLVMSGGDRMRRDRDRKSRHCGFVYILVQSGWYSSKEVEERKSAKLSSDVVYIVYIYATPLRRLPLPEQVETISNPLNNGRQNKSAMPQQVLHESGVKHVVATKYVNAHHLGSLYHGTYYEPAHSIANSQAKMIPSRYGMSHLGGRQLLRGIRSVAYLGLDRQVEKLGFGSLGTGSVEARLRMIATDSGVRFFSYLVCSQYRPWRIMSKRRRASFRLSNLQLQYTSASVLVII